MAIYENPRTCSWPLANCSTKPQSGFVNYYFHNGRWDVKLTGSDVSFLHADHDGIGAAFSGGSKSLWLLGEGAYFCAMRCSRDLGPGCICLTILSWRQPADYINMLCCISAGQIMAAASNPRSARAASAQVIRIKLRLYPGEDDDLIAFSQGIPTGLRAASVKIALRSGVKREPDIHESQDDNLMDALEDLVF